MKQKPRRRLMQIVKLHRLVHAPCAQYPGRWCAQLWAEYLKWEKQS